MKYPNLIQEKKLWKKGYKIVIGLDEAGRGALAGPVVAAAVAIIAKRKSQSAKLQRKVQKLRDSKQLSSLQREKFYKELTKSVWLKWGIGKVSNKIIDKINILEATKLAMEKAVKNLTKKLKKDRARKPTIVGNRAWLILDGNFKINSSLPQKPIVKGDEKVFSCAAASILAKVTRDRIMMRYHKKYPRYRFDLHKGYGTKWHFKLLKKYGPCPLHRRSFNLGLT